MAVKCDNCSNDASYTHADPGVSAANYCTMCLPAWLQDRANAGHFPLVSPIKEEKPAPAKKKAAAAPTEAAPTDESN